MVQRPVPPTQAQDPREFEIQQLRRRFSPTEEVDSGGITFTFHMVPSDPDFPFEMTALRCALQVPLAYPKDGRPSLRVTNKEMGRGYQINVERGFASLAEKTPHATLLGLMNALDKRLESFLTEQKAETVKLIPNAAVGVPARRLETAPRSPFSMETVSVPAAENREPSRVYTTEQKQTAEARRTAEVHQLEARLGRLPLFSKSLDGMAYTLPIEPRRSKDLPGPLQNVRTVKLHVPRLYPLEPCRIELLGVSQDVARKPEKGFAKRAQSSPEMTLMSHVNYFAQHMYTLATEPAHGSEIDERDIPEVAHLKVAEADAKDEGAISASAEDEDDRSHIKVIPRPPEWTRTGEDAEDESEDSDPFHSDDELTDELDEDDHVEANPESTTAPERGISLSFPHLELYGIEILELLSLCITIKCDRCKHTMDISRLRNRPNADASGVHAAWCQKCAHPLSVAYRRELMHANSVRAGYLDLDGCTVIDMLPSNFTPTCSECSTTYPPPGLVSVRGESSMANCRECHRQMTLKIPEVKFLQVSAAAVLRNRPLRKKKKPRENLGIVAGQELPRRGRCNHYSKSYRWFRYALCRARVFLLGHVN